MDHRRAERVDCGACSVSAEDFLTAMAKRRQEVRYRIVTTVHFANGSTSCRSGGVVVVEDDTAELDATPGESPVMQAPR